MNCFVSNVLLERIDKVTIPAYYNIIVSRLMDAAAFET